MSSVFTIPSGKNQINTENPLFPWALLYINGGHSISMSKYCRVQ